MNPCLAVGPVVRLPSKGSFSFVRKMRKRRQGGKRAWSCGLRSASDPVTTHCPLGWVRGHSQRLPSRPMSATPDSAATPLTTPEVWALLALHEAHGYGASAFKAWCEHLLCAGEDCPLLAHLLLDSQIRHLLYLERRLGMPTEEAIRQKAGALIASPRVSRCYLASLSERFPLNDQAMRNGILREAVRIADEPCMAGQRVALRRFTADYHALYRLKDPEPGLAQLAADFRIRFRDPECLRAVPSPLPRTRSMSAEQYLGSWYHLKTLVTAVLGSEGSEIIQGVDWGLSRAEWMLGYLIGEDAEWFTYTVYQAVKYNGGGDERGMGHESFTLVHPDVRTFLAHRIVAFDRHIMPRSGAAPRTLAEACEVIDAIADAEAKNIRPESDFGPPLG